MTKRILLLVIGSTLTIVGLVAAFGPWILVALAGTTLATFALLWETDE